MNKARTIDEWSKRGTTSIVHHRRIPESNITQHSHTSLFRRRNRGWRRYRYGLFQAIWHPAVDYQNKLRGDSILNDRAEYHNLICSSTRTLCRMPLRTTFSARFFVMGFPFRHSLSSGIWDASTISKTPWRRIRIGYWCKELGCDWISRFFITRIHPTLLAWLVRRVRFTWTPILGRWWLD